MASDKLQRDFKQPMDFTYKVSDSGRCNGDSSHVQIILAPGRGTYCKFDVIPHANTIDGVALKMDIHGDAENLSFFNFVEDLYNFLKKNWAEKDMDGYKTQRGAGY